MVHHGRHNQIKLKMEEVDLTEFFRTLPPNPWAALREPVTTFWQDFSIADRFGLDAVRDTYNRALTEWHDNPEYMGEFALTLNHKIWHWHDARQTWLQREVDATNANKPTEAHEAHRRAEICGALSVVYDELWREADDYAHDHFKGEDFRIYWEITD